MTLLIILGGWFALSLIAFFAFALGAGLGHRNGYEQANAEWVALLAAQQQEALEQHAQAAAERAARQ